MIFFLDKPRGFLISNPDLPLTIIDAGGNLFYTNTWITNRVVKFNLPANIPLQLIEGSGHFTEPITYKLKNYKRERFTKKNTENFQVIYEKNPNGASIYWDNECIVIDTKFMYRPIYENTYILCHELGHQYYSSEHKADHYAMNKMLKMGYNPIQIGLAQINVLKKSPERIFLLINKLIK